MANPPYILEATPANFKSLVLENSDKGPVLVFYWSPLAGPCMKLMPRLIRLADEYCGKFLLVLLDTDKYGRLAREEYGVTSVPTVKFFREGKVVHTVHGAESDAEFRRALAKFVPHAADLIQVRALQAYQNGGDLDQACSLLFHALKDDPANDAIALDLAKLLILRNEYARAEDVLNACSAEARDKGEIATLLAHAGFLRVAQGAPDLASLEQAIEEEPGKMIARYQLSAIKLLHNDYAGAMQQLLEIVRRDRAFRDDVGRKGLLAIFNMLGDGHELVLSYRSMLSEVLH
jgi:putative thioredoxin